MRHVEQRRVILVDENDDLLARLFVSSLHKRHKTRTWGLRIRIAAPLVLKA